MQKVKTQCKILRGQKGHFIKSHKWKQSIAIVTPFICTCGKTFVVNWDPFLPFSSSTSRISIVLSHLLFILSVKYWKYSLIIPLSTLRHSKLAKLPRTGVWHLQTAVCSLQSANVRHRPRTAHAEWRESLDPSCMITGYQMFTDVWQEFHMWEDLDESFERLVDLYWNN